MWDLAALGKNIPTEFGAQNKDYELAPLPETTAPAPPRGGRLRRLFRRHDQNLSGTIHTAESVSVRILRVRALYHPNQHRLFVAIRLKRVERIRWLLFRVYKDYDPAHDDPVPRAANLVYSEVLTRQQILALPDENPADEPSPSKKFKWITALGTPPGGVRKCRDLRVVVWVTQRDDRSWPSGGEPEEVPGIEVHDRSLKDAPGELQAALQEATNQPPGAVDPTSGRPWHEVRKRLERRLSYTRDILGKNLTRIPGARTVRVVHFNTSTQLGDARYARGDDGKPKDAPKDLAMALRAALRRAIRKLADAHQPEEARLRKRNCRPLHVFMAPEWYFRPYDRPYTLKERRQVLRRLRKISAAYPEWLIIPGTIYWSATQAAPDTPLAVFNECPVYRGGQRVLMLTKRNEHDLTQKAKEERSEVWGMGDLPNSGRGLTAQQAVTSETSHFEIDAGGKVGRVSFCLDICRDQVVGEGVMRYAADNHAPGGGAGVDIHVLVSAETTRADTRVAARDGGLFFHLDGDSLNTEVLRVTRPAPVSSLANTFRDLKQALADKAQLYADVVEADDALMVAKRHERFPALEQELQRLKLDDAEDKLINDSPNARWSEVRWEILAARIERDGGRDDDLALAQEIARCWRETQDALEAMNSSDAATRVEAAERALRNANVRCEALDEQHGRFGKIVIYNLVELP